MRRQNLERAAGPRLNKLNKSLTEHEVLKVLRANSNFLKKLGGTYNPNKNNGILMELISMRGFASTLAKSHQLLKQSENLIAKLKRRSPRRTSGSFLKPGPTAKAANFHGWPKSKSPSPVRTRMSPQKRSPSVRRSPMTPRRLF